MNKKAATESILQLSLSKKEFENFRNLINKKCGIKMPAAKKTMLSCRLAKRVRAVGFNNFTDYSDYLFSKEGHEKELVHMINAVTTNKTDFFREPNHFKFLETKILPEIIKKLLSSGRRKINIWSAGCSTGEEPYTLAMVLNEYFERQNLGSLYEVFATDISTDVLNKAIMGIYTNDDIEPIPLLMRKKYILRNKDRSKDQVRVAPEIRTKVCFKKLNFMNKRYQVDEIMDVIFCRNVLIYFDREIQEMVINRLCWHLAPDGYLFLGHSETIQGYRTPLTTVYATIYRKNS